MAWTTPKTYVAGNVHTAAEKNTYERDNLNLLKTSINDSGALSCVDKTELTIASGAVTVTQNYHSIGTEGAASTDNLDTLTAGTSVVAGHILVIQPADDGDDVVVINDTGNIKCGSDTTLAEIEDTMTFIYDGTNWLCLSIQQN